MKKQRSLGLIIAIGWSLTPCVLAAFSFLLNRSRYNFALKWADVWLYLFIVGLLLGIVIGLALRWSRPRLRWPGVGLIIASWGLGLLATNIFFPNYERLFGLLTGPGFKLIAPFLVSLALSGAIGGLGTGIALRLFQNPQTLSRPVDQLFNTESEGKPLLGWSRVAVITCGWAIGLTVVGELFIILAYVLYYRNPWVVIIFLPFIWITASASGGAIGSSIMTRQLNRGHSEQMSISEIVWMVLPVIGLALLLVAVVTSFRSSTPGFNMSRCQPNCREVSLSHTYLFTVSVAHDPLEGWIFYSELL
jgi:MFS family permease